MKNTIRIGSPNQKLINNKEQLHMNATSSSNNSYEQEFSLRSNASEDSALTDDLKSACNSPAEHNCENISRTANRHSLTLYYTNCDSVINKRSELETHLQITKPDLVALTEIFPKNYQLDIQQHELELPGYQLFLSNEGQVPKRGAAIYVKDSIRCTKEDVDGGLFQESVWINLELDRTRLLLGCIYRSPSSSSENNSELCNLLKKACQRKHDHLLLVGDFNYRDINWDLNTISSANEDCRNFLNCVDDLFLYQHVLSPTRYREGQLPSTLDLVFTNEEELILDLNYGSPLGKSDHISLSIQLSLRRSDVGEDLLTRNYYQGNYDKIREHLKSIDWKEELSNLSGIEAWHHFEKVLLQCIEAWVPLRKRCVRNRPQWMNHRAIEAIKQKHKSWNRYQKDRSESNWKLFTKHRNIATTEIRNAKANFENKIAEEVKDNSKSFWNYVKSKAKSKAGFPDILRNDGTTAKTDEEKADTFNNFFGSVFTKEDLTTSPSVSKKSEYELRDIEFKAQEIEDLLSKLNIDKSPGPDGINSRILKETSKEVSIPLQMIFTKLMEDETLPDSWKEATVVPLFKKGKRSDPSNYRPVSLTSVVCKVMERLVRKELLQHLEGSGLLSDNQHGFRSGRSCTTQLLEVLEDWTRDIDSGHSIDCIYLDYQKAFDSVPHRRLLCKLQAYGITGHLLKWIEAYLSGRCQRVTVNGKKSASIPVSSGIPQGSVLGPTLFICFINDQQESIKSTMKLFADDTKLYRIVDSKIDADFLQEDMDAAKSWADVWQLKFNETKCKVVHYGRKNQNFSYHLPTPQGPHEIKTETTEKDLGVVFDKSLSFSNHVAEATRKANVKLGLIKRSFTALNERGWLKLYKAIIRPTLEYCNSVWTPLFKKDEDLLEKVQQRATRLLPHLRHLEYAERLRTLNLPTLSYRRQRAELIQIFKIIKGYDRVNPYQFFHFEDGGRTRGHSKKIKKVRFNLKIRQNSFSIRAINNWNGLPEEAVSATSVNMFKSALERHWLSHPLKFSPYQR